MPLFTVCVNMWPTGKTETTYWLCQTSTGTAHTIYAQNPLLKHKNPSALQCEKK